MFSLNDKNCVPSDGAEDTSFTYFNIYYTCVNMVNHTISRLGGIQYSRGTAVTKYPSLEGKNISHRANLFTLDPNEKYETEQSPQTNSLELLAFRILQPDDVSCEH